MINSACGHHRGSSCIFWMGQQPFQMPGPCRQAGWVHRGLGVPVCLTGQRHSGLISRDASIPPGEGGSGCSIPVFCQLGIVPLDGFWPPEFGAEPMLSSPSSAAFRAGRWCCAAPSLQKGRRGWGLPFSASSAPGCAHHEDEHFSTEVAPGSQRLLVGDQ